MQETTPAGPAENQTYNSSLDEQGMAFRGEGVGGLAAKAGAADFGKLFIYVGR